MGTCQYAPGGWCDDPKCIHGPCKLAPTPVREDEQTLLETCNRLIQGWLSNAERRHLTNEQFAKLIEESEDTVDKLVALLANEATK